ncbi:hypothetical protein V2J09_007558 [Rumex salicifolius]
MSVELRSKENGLDFWKHQHNGRVKFNSTCGGKEVAANGSHSMNKLQIETDRSQQSAPMAGTPSNQKATPSSTTAKTGEGNRDFLNHLEVYLAKRDGVDKLLKISRYASKIILASPALSDHPLRRRLKSFESSVGVSRKAFRLGKFVQNVNALRATPFSSSAGGCRREHRLFILLSAVAYGGEGIYYFVEQFVWLAKAGLIDPKHSRKLQKISAWAEFVGYVGSVGLKIRDLRKLNEDKACVDSNLEISATRGVDSDENMERERALRLKIAMKKLSIVQDLADWLMTLSDVWDEDGKFLTPMVLSCAGLLSALISTHKNWISC